MRKGTNPPTGVSKTHIWDNISVKKHSLSKLQVITFCQLHIHSTGCLFEVWVTQGSPTTAHQEVWTQQQQENKKTEKKSTRKQIRKWLITEMCISPQWHRGGGGRLCFGWSGGGITVAFSLIQRCNKGVTQHTSDRACWRSAHPLQF